MSPQPDPEPPGLGRPGGDSSPQSVAPPVPAAVAFDAERENTLARTFVRLADTLVSDYDVAELLADLVDSCVQLLDVDAAGILLQHGDRLQVAAASSRSLRDIEVFQVETDEGPCLDSVRTGSPVVSPDLEHINSWPAFTKAALRRGLRAVYALPLQLRGEVIGGLNMFRSTTYTWSSTDMITAKALADVATIGVLQQRTATRSAVVQSQLQHALDSRVLIEQAKGVLAGQTGLDPEAAFTILRAYARNGNLKLRDVAQATVDGELRLSDLRTPSP